MAEAFIEKVRDAYIKLGYGMPDADKAARDAITVMTAFYRDNKSNQSKVQEDK